MSATTELVEVAEQIAHGIKVIRGLTDTRDCLCSEAIDALDEAIAFVDDVLTCLADGRVTELPGPAPP